MSLWRRGLWLLCSGGAFVVAWQAAVLYAYFTWKLQESRRDTVLTQRDLCGFGAAAVCVVAIGGGWWSVGQALFPRPRIANPDAGATAAASEEQC